MDRVIRSATHIAKKTYNCDACYWWLRSGFTLDDCENEEQINAFIDARYDKWKILPGQRYRKIVGIYEGEIVTFKARIDMDDMCKQLDVYPYD